jgi:CheY-like chemotaxis protein
MKDLTVLPNETSREQVPCIRLLLADDDDRARSLLAECARDVLPASTSLLEARDGTDALELAVQRRPQIALLDVNMPRLGGVEVALRLRALQPPMRLALQTADPGEHRERALARRLPLFDKFEIGRALSWLEVQAQACAGDHSRTQPLEKPVLACSSCRYGIACTRPPQRCPMCEAQDSWIRAPWRPFRHASSVGLARMSQAHSVPSPRPVTGYPGPASSQVAGTYWGG